MQITIHIKLLKKIIKNDMVLHNFNNRISHSIESPPFGHLSFKITFHA